MVAIAALVATVRLHAQSADHPSANGAFSLEQARRGARSVTECTRCHGADLEGDLAPPLVGPAHRARWSMRPLAELYERVAANVARDPSAPAHADIPARAADVTAYLLLVNGFRAGTRDLTTTSAAFREARVGEPTPR